MWRLCLGNGISRSLESALTFLPTFKCHYFTKGVVLLLQKHPFTKQLLVGDLRSHPWAMHKKVNLPHRACYPWSMCHSFLCSVNYNLVSFVCWHVWSICPVWNQVDSHCWQPLVAGHQATFGWSVCSQISNWLGQNGVLKDFKLFLYHCLSEALQNV